MILFASIFHTHRSGCREGPGHIIFDFFHTKIKIFSLYVVGDHGSNLAHSDHTGRETVYWADIDSTASKIDYSTLNCSTFSWRFCFSRKTILWMFFELFWYFWYFYPRCGLCVCTLLYLHSYFILSFSYPSHISSLVILLHPMKYFSTTNL